MILLFGEKAQNTTLLGKNTSVKNQNNPVENSGILAMNDSSSSLSFLNAAEYDDFVSSNPVAINYAAYSQWSEGEASTGYNAGNYSTEGVFSEGGDFGTEAAGFAGAGAGFAGACAASAGFGGGCSFGGGGFSSVC